MTFMGSRAFSVAARYIVSHFRIEHTVDDFFIFASYSYEGNTCFALFK